MLLNDPKYLNLLNHEGVRDAVGMISANVHGIAGGSGDGGAHAVALEGFRALTPMIAPEMGVASEMAFAVNNALDMADRQRAEAERTRAVMTASSPEEAQDLNQTKAGAARDKGTSFGAPEAPVAETRGIDAARIRQTLYNSNRTAGGDVANETSAGHDIRQVRVVNGPVRASNRRPEPIERLTESTAKSFNGMVEALKGDKQRDDSGNRAVLVRNDGNISRTSPPNTPSVPRPSASVAPRQPSSGPRR